MQPQPSCAICMTLLLGLLWFNAQLMPHPAQAAPLAAAPQAQTFTVNSTDDDDDGACEPRTATADCTLREAILAANAAPGRDTIAFNLPGQGVQVIEVGSVDQKGLPRITDSVVIDGFTQPGAKPNTAADHDNAVRLIQVNGLKTRVASGLILAGGDSLVRGLIIHVFHGNGIELTQKSGNRIEGNYIHGIFNAGVYVYESPRNRVGGTMPAARNLIGLNGEGVSITGSRATHNWVQGNFIGTDATGKDTRGNGMGVFIENAANNIVGGRTPGARNIIASNSCCGVYIFGANAARNRVQGNLIGRDVTGTTPLANGVGILIYHGRKNVIGGRSIRAGNIIASNKEGGVVIGESSSIENRILSNNIFSNKGLGIDLGEDGVTPNDYGPPHDTDSGPNNSQNYPVLSSIHSNRARTTLSGTLKSTPHTRFRLEFFYNAACDGSGYGEGQTLLGASEITTDSTGGANFQVSFGIPIAVGGFVTATATNAKGNTSEFSQCLAVSALAREAVP